MNFDPQRFFIGVIDLFSVLLPGMIAVYIVDATWAEAVMDEAYPDLSGASAVVAFLVLAYMVGHIIFLLGAVLLDNLIYDKLRHKRVSHAGSEPVAASESQAVDASVTPPLSNSGWRRILMGDSTVDDAAYERVRGLQQESLSSIDADGTMNAFQWSRARLLLEQPGALARVERFEADSKFFRSLAVLLLLLIPPLAVHQRWGLALVVSCLMLLAVWRYADQRRKSITQSYRFVISIEASRARSLSAQGVAKPPGQSTAQAGA